MRLSYIYINVFILLFLSLLLLFSCFYATIVSVWGKSAFALK